LLLKAQMPSDAPRIALGDDFSLQSLRTNTRSPERSLRRMLQFATIRFKNLFITLVKYFPERFPLS
jgi:hypothetical protein